MFNSVVLIIIDNRHFLCELLVIKYLSFSLLK